MKILNLSPFSLIPIDQGGKLRIYTLNKHLAKKHDIVQFSCNFFKKGKSVPFKSWKNKISEKYVEYVYSPPQAMAFSLLLHELKISPLTYVNEYLKWSMAKIPWKGPFDLIQIEGPWMFDWARKKFPETPIVHSSHNVEYLLVEDKKNFQAESVFHKKSLNKVFEVEKRAVEQSAVTFVCSDKDIEDFVRVYKCKKDKLVIVPNGIDSEELQSGSKDKLKQMHDLEGKKVVLYVSGVHQPNIEAMHFILKFAQKYKRKDVVFVIAGSVGQGKEDSSNVRFTGWLPHEKILDYFRLADVALSPIRYGSGTDIKLLQYLAAGIPTIATKFGTRGLKSTEGILIAETEEEYIAGIDHILDNPSFGKEQSDLGRELVKPYDYRLIAQQVEKEYKKVKASL